MKRAQFILVAGMLITPAVINNVNAGILTCTATANLNCDAPLIVWGGSNCATYTDKCYTNPSGMIVIRLRNCLTCTSAGTLTTVKQHFEECSGHLEYKTCVNNIGMSCTDRGADNCTSTNWANVSGKTGYQSHTESVYNNTTHCCDSTVVYRCAAGYYGRPTSTTSGCTKCPSYTKVNGASPDTAHRQSGALNLTVSGTSTPGTGIIMGCYISANSADSPYNDVSGYFYVTENCYNSDNSALP